MSLDLSSMPAKIQLMYETLKQQNLHGTDQDTIPEGFGEFGLEITNPVPTDTIIGSAIYLAGLRTSEGMKVDSERMGSNEAANVENPIDLYRIRENGKVIAIIYISAYHKKNSGRAPEGFKII